ncbi:MULTISPECIES: ChbG/HpnK family deacetylase [Gammaproteobacteria]|uniref:ChbG/HpnK family deacetylase n=1 Tax=Gammaproteobacteria TaxID=1236 RepID=UPI001911859C|nr:MULTISPECIES: ChbG/HpnK family deacetylase [Gammaproteobacteria]MBK5300731.1 ChbG/HpnK family deacetylase [Bacillus sp. TH86]MBK5320500.1 ChbG/HpnK family deacetylase [Bacillus sp. TH59]MBK5335450.1 ChbG/HpnK family deacetylase [Bacillus sp. TH57]MBK5309537.1 ChbG/HpnK family deacetylase [Pseudomonas sp. TH71]MBK5314999.1 ChbG/HpnK family deacetylase [Erwinia sp. TH79]
MPRQVIVNADDFGLSSSENAVILGAFKAGVISSATAMANMPAFEEACVLSQQSLLQGRIGLHFNLTYGRPLSPSILTRSTFCDSQGVFNLNLPRHSLWLNRQDRDAVLEELEAQWQRCLDNGLRPSHIDSHQHVHNIWPVGEIVARFAARQGVPVRLARHLGNNLSVPKRVFKTLFNHRLNRLAGATAQYVCTPVDLRNVAMPIDGLLEIVVHPTHIGADFGDIYLNPGESLAHILEKRLPGIPRVSYAVVPRTLKDEQQYSIELRPLQP